MSQRHANGSTSLLKAIKENLAQLKGVLSTREPWSKEIENLRGSVRNKIMHLLFNYPTSPEAQKVDNLLWLDTSYAVIKVYRQRLAVLDETSNATPTKGPRPIVQLRKLQTKFRSFLSDEEMFWSGFALRLVGTFKLAEANSALLALNINVQDPNNPFPDISHSTLPPSSVDTTSTPGTQPTHTLDDPQRQAKLLLVHKVLVCLGDLSRYKEQYNESGGRPKAGQHGHTDDWKPRRGRGKKGMTESVVPRDRDYSKAAEYYHQARLLVPDNGNPANQLSVLAVWQNDPFMSIYYCYRAICVRKPFPTAKDNLESTLRKAVETFKKGDDPTQPISVSFKQHALLLHAMWITKPNKASLPSQAAKLSTTFQSLLSGRSLTSEEILQTVCMAIGAHWHVRLFVQASPEERSQPTAPNTSTKPVELLILEHILSLYRCLMDVGVSEMSESGSEADPDLAQRITAVFRRMLPTLRIASKWLRGNLAYIQQKLGIAGTASEFWSAYIRFAQKLQQTFPKNKMPSLAAVILDEDVDMKGFSPLKDTLQTASGCTEATTGMHPNEEHLVRIADLTEEVLLIVNSEASPLLYRNGEFFFGTTSANMLAFRARGVLIESSDDDEEQDTDSQKPAAGDDVDDRGSSVAEDAFTTSSRTEDDPVTLAMRATLESDEEERVLYPVSRKSSRINVQESNSMSLAPILPNPAHSHLSAPDEFMASRPSFGIKVAQPRLSITAEDLLAQALGGGASASSPISPLQGKAPQTPTYFASHPLPAPLTPPSAQSAQPLLFGSSSSVWGRPQPKSRRSLGPQAGKHAQGYSLSHIYSSLDQQSWGRPHEMFGRSVSDPAAGPENTKPAFNPAPGAEVFGRPRTASAGGLQTTQPLASSHLAADVAGDMMNGLSEDLRNRTTTFYAARSSNPWG